MAGSRARHGICGRFCGALPQRRGLQRRESETKPRKAKESQEAHVPCDFRLYEKDGKTKNEHFREMLSKASERGVGPEYVVFDSWCSGLDNLKCVSPNCLRCDHSPFFYTPIFCALQHRRLC